MSPLRIAPQLELLSLLFIAIHWNVKETAPLSSGASVHHGVEVETTAGHENRGADSGCRVSTCAVLGLNSGIADSFRKSSARTVLPKTDLLGSFNLVGVGNRIIPPSVSRPCVPNHAFQFLSGNRGIQLRPD